MQPAATLPAGMPVRATEHATAVSWFGRGLLIRGSSGSGKSSLALRLIAAGAGLVADDLTVIRPEGDHLVAEPAGEPGLIEARGLGIFRLVPARRVRLSLVVELGGGASADRLPALRWATLLGVHLPTIVLDGTAPDAHQRLLLTLAAARAA